MSNIKKIVLSGGPCGGKSRGANSLKNMLQKLGFDVFLVTESAEKLLSNGIDRKNLYDFQRAIALNQLKMEAIAEEKAKITDNPIIICDRGLMDAKVYLSDNDFLKLKEELKLSEVIMRDRYDAVFHMDSSANNGFYKNSDIRIENYNEASILNDKSLNVWCGNPHYRFIPACDSFQEKMDILFKEVCSFIGIPKPLEIERKFLIRKPDVSKLLSMCCSNVSIKQYYLEKDGKSFRIRSRGINNDNIYTKTIKNKITDTVYEEFENKITAKEFDEYLKDSSIIGTINKDRYCLMYKGVYYEIDIFPFWKKQAYLEVELLTENDVIVLPDFIEVIEDVTSKPEYKNRALSIKIPEEKIQTS